MKVIVLDSSPLALIVQRPGIPAADECRAWVRKRIASGHRILVPEIIRYELRRELLRLGKTRSLAAIDQFTFAEPDRLLRITSKDLDLAATLWADTRRRGIVTADPRALDIDVILAAQSLNAGGFLPGELVVATSNVGHLAGMVPCERWEAI